MNIKYALVAAGLLLTAACSHATEKSNTLESAIGEQPEDEPPGAGDPGDDSPVLTLSVDDLDGDEVPETWYTRVSLCGTGGCTYSIHLSTRPGETFGEAFGKTFYPSGPRPSDARYGDPTGFQGEQRGGLCYYSLDRYTFDGVKYAMNEGASTDCHVVINRPDNAPIADGEYRCFTLIPRNPCRTTQPGVE